MELVPSRAHTSLCALHNWTAQRCSQSYTETRRRRKETEVARRIKGGMNRRDTTVLDNTQLVEPSVMEG